MTDQENVMENDVTAPAAVESGRCRPVLVSVEATGDFCIHNSLLSLSYYKYYIYYYNVFIFLNLITIKN